MHSQFVPTSIKISNCNAIGCKAQVSSTPGHNNVKRDFNFGLCTKIPLKSSGMSIEDLRIDEVVSKQMRWGPQADVRLNRIDVSSELLEASYERCRYVCAEYAKTFYLGTQLMTEERRKAIWAIYDEITFPGFHYVFDIIQHNTKYDMPMRTDELVDGPNATHTNKEVLDRWEERLEDIFDGKPYDMFDAALTDTIYKFPLDIKPFRDMIEGMRMDTVKWRYKNFQELYLYCYYVAGTVGLMSVPVMGIAPESNNSVHSIYNAALYLGIGNQLTNILRDVGEDAIRGRIYLPQDELAQFGITEDDIFSKKVTDNWKQFMKEQIARARFYFNQAEEGASQLNEASRWPVWASLLLYRKILDSVEENGYDNLNKRAYVGRTKRILMLPLAFARAANFSNLFV